MITYGITVSDEEFEFKRLINSLQPYLSKDEEIVVLGDSNKITDNIIEHASLCGLKVNLFNFQKNFSDYKNQLFNLSSNEYLFQVDADEQVPPSLLYLLRSVAQTKEADLVWIPRINVIHGTTMKDIENFKWNVNERGWEGFPDYQARFVNTKANIIWHGEVHEVLRGAKNPKIIQQSPIELYSILHVKNIEKQRKQNLFYKQIEK